MRCFVQYGPDTTYQKADSNQTQDLLCVCFGSARADSEQTLGSPKPITESSPLFQKQSMTANDGSGLTNRPVNHDNFFNALTNQRADQSDS